jgi:hypothetical protein
MNNNVKNFLQFINESKEDKKKITFELEFDWTRADQMTRSEAAQSLKDELMKNLPDGAKIVGAPRLDGWKRSRKEPIYWMPYTAEVAVSFTGPESEIMKWAKSLSLDILDYETE